MDDWQSALAKFEREWKYITQGKTPPPEESDACTLADLCNAFLNAKRRKMEADDLSPRTFEGYRQTTDGLIAHFGKERRVDDLRPLDFEKLREKLAKRLSVVSLKNEVNRIRVVFKFASKSKLIDEEVDYGGSFDRPSAKALRRARNTAGPRLFEANEIRRILDALDGKEVPTDKTDPKTGKPVTYKRKPDPVLKAQVLLGLNGALGNSDLSHLPQSAFDFDNGWLDYPRVKTEIPRRIPLWPETIAALKASLEVRPKPASRDNADLCFLTVNGRRWVRVQESKKNGRPVAIDALSQKFAKLLKALKINGRKGLGFYTLRHVFATIGGNSRDPESVAAIMGHVDSSIGSVYRERIPDERLRAVVDVVHRWLFDDHAGGEAAAVEAAADGQGEGRRG